MKLRNCTIDDAWILHKEIGCNSEMKHYTGWDPYGTPESAKAFIANVLDSADDYLWIIEEDGEAVGQIGAYDYNAEEQSIEIGYSIFQQYWGKGYALQAVASACEILFSKEFIRNIKAWSARENIASAKVLELNGFKTTEISESSLNINGETFDQIFYERSMQSARQALDQNYVFVYGTLMRGMRNHDVFLRDEQLIGNAEADGFDMYDLGTYPGIVRGSGTVQGEVYLVSDKDVKRLDQLESEGFLYKREVVNVKLEEGGILNVFVYVYLRSIEGRRKMEKRYGSR